MIDRSYLTDGRRYLRTAEAADYTGFEDPTTVGPELQGCADRTALRSFREWARRKGVHPCPGREGMWERRHLDEAMQQRTTPQQLSAVAALAIAHARSGGRDR